MDTRRISFVDHPGFHRAALHMAVAGGLAGLAAHVTSLLEPRIGNLAAPLPLAVVAGAAVYGAAAAETRARARDLAVVVLGAAFAAAALSAVRRGDMSAPWGAALFAGALGLLVARGVAGRRFWIAAAAGAAGALLGRFVLGALTGLSFGPSWLVAGCAGTAFGVVTLLGTLPRHLLLERVASAPAETAELLARARQMAGSEPKIAALLEQLDDLGRQSAAIFGAGRAGCPAGPAGRPGRGDHRRPGARRVQQGAGSGRRAAGGRAGDRDRPRAHHRPAAPRARGDQPGQAGRHLGRG